MLRLIRWSATSVLAVVLVAWGVVWLARGNPDGRAASLLRQITARLDESVIGAVAPFSLIDSTGRPVTDATYRGKWLLIYFGYTDCPDICPTMLQSISVVLDELGEKAVQVAPLFITVDPERDTTATLAQYVALFDQRLIGLTGTPRQVTAAQAAYGVYSRRIAQKGDDGYMVDHSSNVYLTAPDGKVTKVFQDGLGEADMVQAILAAMAERK